MWSVVTVKPAAMLASSPATLHNPELRIINLTINNVPLDDAAFSKGFVTGATFFIVGNTVGDGYVCTVEYLPPGGGAKIVKSAHDAIYLSMGATASAPPHARQVKSMDEAARIMAHKCLGSPLNELGQDLLKTATP
jgi:hypothetical protein